MLCSRLSRINVKGDLAHGFGGWMPADLTLVCTGKEGTQVDQQKLARQNQGRFARAVSMGINTSSHG
jgi:hypothetical protein